MLQITKPEVSLRQALIEREEAVHERRHAIREGGHWVGQYRYGVDWDTYYYLLGAQWTYAQAATEAGFNHDVLSLSECVEAATKWFGESLSGNDLASAERGREFALSIIRGLELK